MEFILTGESATATEFERLGLVSKVFPKEQVLDEAIKLATRIAGMSGPVVIAAKQAVLAGKFLFIYYSFIHTFPFSFTFWVVVVVIMMIMMILLMI